MHYLDMQEKIRHGTSDFPFAFYHIEPDHPRYNMAFHWHGEWELLRVLSGRFDSYLDGEKYEVYPGQLLLVSPGVLHGGASGGDAPAGCTSGEGSLAGCVYECAVFDPQALLMHPEGCRRCLQGLLAPDVRILPLFGDSHPAVLSAARQLFDSAAGQKEGWQLFVAGALFSLFGALLRDGCQKTSAPAARPGAGHAEKLRPVLEYIDAHYMEPVSLPQLARLAGMSPRYFCRFFAAYIHRTPIDYLNFYRIEQACLLLSAGQLSVTEIAYRCGFSDSSYFAKIFQKYKGISPLQYRKCGAP
ncbi:MAG: AraC family transcriptional regulator [Eubacteriales bacterium]|nr:AraC family transcriptional regulator [Eubacteriales bacterium]